MKRVREAQSLISAAIEPGSECSFCFLTLSLQKTSTDSEATTWTDIEPCVVVVQIRKMTRENIPAHVHGHGAGGPLLAQDTGEETCVTNFPFEHVKSDANRTVGSETSAVRFSSQKLFLTSLF